MNNKKLLSRKDIMNLSEMEQIIFLRDELNLDEKASQLNFEKSLSDYWTELIRIHPSRMLNPKGITQDIKLSAAYFLLYKLLSDKVQIIKRNKILLRSEDFGWVHLNKVHICDFRNLFLIVIDRCGLNQTKYKELVSSVVRSLKTNYASSNNVIQLKNCHFDGGIYYDGIYEKEVPNFYIPHFYDSSLCNLDDVPEFVDFINYLSSNNKEVYDFILNTLASAFIQNIDFRSQNSYILRLFNQSNEDVDNIFIDLCKEIFYSEDNTIYEDSFFEISNNYKSNKATKFNSMILVDYDREREHISENISNFIKKLTDYDRFKFYDFYEKYSSSNFLGLVIMPSKCAFKIDTDDAKLIDKFVEVRIDKKLKKSQEWYSELFNNDKLNIVRNFLIKKALGFKEDSIINIPNILKNNQTDITKSNNNVLKFIEDFGRDNFENCSVRFIFDKYNLWCENNNEIALRNAKFNSIIELELGLKREARRVTQISDRDEECGNLKHSEGSKRNIKCWVKC